MASTSGKTSNSSQVSYSEDSQPTAPHEEQKGQEDRTLVGNSVSKSFNDTTAFTSEGRVITSTYDIPLEDELSFTDVHPREENTHTIEAILSRAVKLQTLEFKTSHKAGQLITSPAFDVMNTLRTAPGFSMARSKLQNFYGIRFTAKMRVTLNPQPFESGMFQILFIPTVRTFPPVVDLTSTAITDECKLPYATSCPNVLCNISTQSEVELVIPYTGSSPFLPLGRKESDFGCFYIQSIVPITDSTNAASCDLSVYMSLHDVVLFGATSAVMPSSTGAVPQMMQPPTNECNMKTSGPLTNIGSKLLPLLDSLGLSAPVADPNPQRVSIAPFANLSHSNSTKNCFKLSLLSTHQLSQAPLGIDRADEMSISHIISKPTYYNQFNWTTSNGEDSVLMTYHVEPNCRLWHSKSADFLVNAPTRLRYVSNCFRYWRGTIRYFFHVVANKFHSGRLRFVYDCGAAGTGVQLNDYPKTFTHVIDIRDATNFVLDCPYFGISPWRRVPNDVDSTNYRYKHSDNEISGTFFDPICSLKVYVENQLRAPDTAASSVVIVVQVAAGDDFEFAAPMSPFSIPTTQYAKPTSSKIGFIDALHLIHNQDVVLPERSFDVIAPPSRDYIADANKARSQFGLNITDVHMKQWNMKDGGEDDLGPYALLPAHFVEQFNLTFPNFKRYHDRYYQKISREHTSSTGARPQALDMVPINMVGPGSSNNSSVTPHQFTVGEKVQSIRQLIKRYQQITTGNLAFTSAINSISFVMLPFYLAAPSDTSSMSTDYLAYFSFLYRFYRGSIRIMLASSDPSLYGIVKYDPSYQAEVEIDSATIFSYRVGIYNIKTFPTGVSFNTLRTSVSQPFNTNLQGSVELEIPYYSKFTKLGVRGYSSRTPLPYFQDMDRDYVPAGQVFINVNKVSSTISLSTLTVYRAAADDYNLGYLLGPPLCRVNVTLS